MNIKHEQFIGIYENAFSKEYCDQVIAHFDSMDKAGYSINRQQLDEVSKKFKEDSAVFCNHEINLQSAADLQNTFNKILWETYYPIYSDEFWALKELGPHNSYSYKIQKTEPSQGYHMWHCEAGSRETSNRILAWTLYLNDVEEGGETEFIYQRLRVKPKQGTLVIWPAAFTHTHRGNPPLSNTKYIVTGWIEF